jgi:hypothetical protein
MLAAWSSADLVFYRRGDAMKLYYRVGCAALMLGFVGLSLAEPGKSGGQFTPADGVPRVTSKPANLSYRGEVKVELTGELSVYRMLMYGHAASTVEVGPQKKWWLNCSGIDPKLERNLSAWDGQDVTIKGQLVFTDLSSLIPGAENSPVLIVETITLAAPGGASPISTTIPAAPVVPASAEVPLPPTPDTKPKDKLDDKTADASEKSILKGDKPK